MHEGMPEIHDDNPDATPMRAGKCRDLKSAKAARADPHANLECHHARSARPDSRVARSIRRSRAARAHDVDDARAGAALALPADYSRVRAAHNAERLRIEPALHEQHGDGPASGRQQQRDAVPDEVRVRRWLAAESIESVWNTRVYCTNQHYACQTLFAVHATSGYTLLP